MLSALLREIRRAETSFPFPFDCLVGIDEPDDAAVIKIADDLALIQTVDFFPPLVDDPFQYGAIAAANAMSDVYAMGGEVTWALAIATFPEELPLEIVSAIFNGAAVKLAEGGGIILGGHTIRDLEPKFGLCVTGTAHPSKVLRKAGAKPGDLLYLTKPLGTGIMINAKKTASVATDHFEKAVAWMETLNRRPAQLAVACQATAMTDVTGFGLAGHASEMAHASGVELIFNANALPILEGALECATNGIRTSGDERNRAFLNGKLTVDPSVPSEISAIIFDPQTNGGLLASVPSSSAARLEEEFRSNGLPLWRVGRVEEGLGVSVDFL